MSSLIGLIVMVAALFPFPILARAEDSGSNSPRVFLLEFSIERPHRVFTGAVRCSPDEIEAGLWNLINFDPDQDNTVRRLEPSYQPLENKAAWYIDDHRCRGLAPFFNGIGFDAYDPHTGRAVVYLARFARENIDLSEWNADGNAYTKMRLIFQPEFRVGNLLKFDAQCDSNETDLSVRIGLEAPELHCTLADAKGFVRLGID